MFSDYRKTLTTVMLAISTTAYYKITPQNNTCAVVSKISLRSVPPFKQQIYSIKCVRSRE